MVLPPVAFQIGAVVFVVWELLCSDSLVQGVTIVTARQVVNISVALFVFPV